MTAAEPSNLPEWADPRSAVALTGIDRVDLAWALAHGDVAYTTTLPEHLGVPMLRLAEVRALVADQLTDRTDSGRRRAARSAGTEAL